MVSRVRHSKAQVKAGSRQWLPLPTSLHLLENINGRQGQRRPTNGLKQGTEENGCRLPPQGSSVAGPSLTQAVRLSSIAVPLAPDDACAKSTQFAS